MNIKNIRPLNDAERKAIGSALSYYITVHGDKKSWSQKVILEEMLYELMWAELATPRGGE